MPPCTGCRPPEWLTREQIRANLESPHLRETRAGETVYSTALNGDWWGWHVREWGLGTAHPWLTPCWVDNPEWADQWRDGVPEDWRPEPSHATPWHPLVGDRVWWRNSAAEVRWGTVLEPSPPFPVVADADDHALVQPDPYMTEGGTRVTSTPVWRWLGDIQRANTVPVDPAALAWLQGDDEMATDGQRRQARSDMMDATLRNMMSPQMRALADADVSLNAQMDRALSEALARDWRRLQPPPPIDTRAIERAIHDAVYQLGAVVVPGSVRINANADPRDPLPGFTADVSIPYSVDTSPVVVHVPGCILDEHHAGGCCLGDDIDYRTLAEDYEEPREQRAARFRAGAGSAEQVAATRLARRLERARARTGRPAFPGPRDRRNVPRDACATCGTRMGSLMICGRCHPSERQEASLARQGAFCLVHRRARTPRADGVFRPCPECQAELLNDLVRIQPSPTAVGLHPCEDGGSQGFFYDGHSGLWCQVHRHRQLTTIVDDTPSGRVTRCPECREGAMTPVTIERQYAPQPAPVTDQSGMCTRCRAFPRVISMTVGFLCAGCYSVVTGEAEIEIGDYVVWYRQRDERNHVGVLTDKQAVDSVDPMVGRTVHVRWISTGEMVLLPMKEVRRAAPWEVDRHSARHPPPAARDLAEPGGGVAFTRAVSSGRPGDLMFCPHCQNPVVVGPHARTLPNEVYWCPACRISLAAPDPMAAELDRRTGVPPWRRYLYDAPRPRLGTGRFARAYMHDATPQTADQRQAHAVQAAEARRALASTTAPTVGAVTAALVAGELAVATHGLPVDEPAPVSEPADRGIW